MAPMKNVSWLLLVATVLGACAGVGNLVPGEAQVADVQRVLGEPALSWRDADGSTHLAYPRGPMGYQTFMVQLDPAGKLRSVENVLDTAHFAAIAPGMDEQQVLHALGPPQPAWTVYFKARDELAWEWRYCDDWHAANRFDVLFDATTGTVRSTLSVRETCRNDACWCAR
ncbi:MAG: hypothetical protein PHY45_01860 [Rhodocyclaceae bacterium]|nr:hypothetical protein [Rhodocyclaceae bacterium]